MAKITSIILVFWLIGLQLVLAQYPPRIDDHYWRRKVHFRIDLNEKINVPIKQAESPLYLPEEGINEGKYTKTAGVVMAIMSAFEKGEIDAYNPDTLTKPVSFNRAKKILEGYLPENEGGGDSGGDDLEGGDDFFDEGDDFDFGGDEEVEAGAGDVLPTEDKNNYDELFRPMTAVLDLVEDRIFDKNKSDMYYDLQWVRFVAIDPYGKLIDKNVVAFRYKDIMPILNETLWKNRFNDAEYRSIQEILELRLFNSYNINISGVGPKTLLESDKRSQQMVEFEHHLWEF